jgi:putative membrane protein
MARLVGWIAGLPVALLLALFAAANRHDIRLELWPLPWSVDLPVYLAVLGALGLGLVIGLAVAWLSGHKARSAARRQRHRAESLARQIDQAQIERAKPTA